MANEVEPRCLIISGSPECDAEFLRRCKGKYSFVICADSGFSHARNAGITPDLLVGDFDSYFGELPDDIELVRLNPEKDFSDTVHCAEEAVKRGFKDIDIACALGGRLDHAVANLYALEYIKNLGAEVKLVSDREIVSLLSNESVGLDGFAGITFSVFPFGCESAVVSIKGAKYPLEMYVMESSVPIGLSNEMTEDFAEIEVHRGKALLIVNYYNR